MKLFLDENIHRKYARRLLRLFPGSIYAGENERFRGWTDREIYALLVSRPYTLVTGDMDFTNKILFPPGPTGGIVVIRPKGMTAAMAHEKLLLFLSSSRPEALKGSLTVLSKATIRTRAG